MTSKPPENEPGYAAEEKEPVERIREQSRQIRQCSSITAGFELMPDMIMVLNSCRQTVYANRLLLDFIHARSMRQVLGKRPGDLLGCVYAHSCRAGCGTSVLCRYCGAVNSILASLSGKTNVSDCRITNMGMEHILFSVWTQPLRLKREKYVVFIVRDRVETNSWNGIAQRFFSNLLNLLSNIEAVMGFYEENPTHMKASMDRMFQHLTQEIIEAKELVEIEGNSFVLTPDTIDSVNLLQSVIASHARFPAGSRSAVDPAAESFVMRTDPRLLAKVLVTMIRLAQSQDSLSQLFLNCRKSGENGIFSIRSDFCIPEDVVAGLRRDMRTSITARNGIRIYCSKLILALYLHGWLEVEVDPEHGSVLTITVPLNIERLPV